MELTREQAIAEHRKMWRWLAEHPNKNKADYLLGEKQIRVLNLCFLCQYTGGKCAKCPLDWENECCCDEGDLYDKWGRIQNARKKAELAKQIAELPEREVEDE